MKVLLCPAPFTLDYVERDIPQPAADEVLLKIKAVGICGTDIHAWTGRQPFFSYPRVFGHEICGVVEKLGSASLSVKTGQRYAVIPCLPCHQCRACREGKTNCCEHVSLYGVHQDGAFCEYMAVKAANLVAIPDALSDSAAALVECFAISAHANRRAEVQAGENIIVVGAGPIGLGAAAIATARGAKVIVADIDAARRQQASAIKGVVALDPCVPSWLDDVRSHFDGDLACTLFDATGNKASMSQAVNAIRHGGKIVFIGLFLGDLVIDDPTFHKKETTLLSSRNATREDFEAVIALMAEGKISENVMKNREYSFSEVGHRYKEDVVENKTLVKGVIFFEKRLK